MSATNPINWLSETTKSKKAPSATPDAEGVYAKYVKALKRVDYYDWRFETEHYVISLPRQLTWERIVAVNKNTLRVDFDDSLIFPAGIGDADYLPYRLAACLRFVDWIKQKEKSPFHKVKEDLAPLTEEDLTKLKNEFKDGN